MSDDGASRAKSRRLASVLITDIAGSTETAADLGDKRWRQVLEAHDALARSLVKDSGGEWLKSTGDGFMAYFTNPGEAVDVGLAFIAQVKQAEGLDVRGGVHTGECEFRDGDLAGLAVHVAARVSAEAAPGELLVSRTVRDLIVGGDYATKPAGTKTLKGVPGRWQLYRVSERARPVSKRAEKVPAAVPSQKPARTDAAGMPTVLLVDDHPLWRGTLRSVIEQGKVGAIVGEASDGAEAVEMAVELKPDVVMMDMQIPTMTGTEATAAIRERLPSARVVVLSSQNDPPTVLAAVRAGAVGYLLKTADAAEIRTAIIKAAAGELVFPPELADVVLSGLRGGGEAAATGQAEQLSAREQEVLELMAEGLSNQAIAERLFLSAKTIETHLTSIFSKLDIPPTNDVNRRVKAVVAYLATAKSQG